MTYRYGCTCSHCHTLNYEGAGTWPYCQRCGHRADVCRMHCDCRACDQAALDDVLPVADDPYPEDPWRPREGGSQ